MSEMSKRNGAGWVDGTLLILACVATFALYVLVAWLVGLLLAMLGLNPPYWADIIIAIICFMAPMSAWIAWELRHDTIHEHDDTREAR